MKNVMIATFDRVEPAEQLQQRLKNAGLETTVNDESKREKFWFMSEPRAAVHVGVDEENYVAARGLIGKLEDSEPFMQEAIRCPDCGSSRIEFPQVTRKFAMPFVEVLLMKMHILPRSFYCQECHYTWPEEQPTEPELDRLGFLRKPKVLHKKRIHRARVKSAVVNRGD